MSANIELNIVGLGDFSDINAKLTALKTQVASLQKGLAGTSLTSDLSTQLNNLNNNFKATMLSSGQFTEATVKLKTETENFGQALVSGKLKLNEYFSIIKNQSSQATNQLKALAIEQTKLQNSTIVQQAGKAGVFSVYTPTQIDQVANATKIATNYQNLYNIAVEKGSQSLINWGKNTQWAGRQLTVGMSVPLMLFANQATTAFKDVNTELTRLQRLYGEGLVPPSQAQLDQISGQVINLGQKVASSMGIAQKDTVQVAANFAAMGREGQNLLDTTYQTQRLSKLGAVDASAATNTIVALQNVYKVSTNQLADAVNFLSDIQKQTTMTLGDMTQAIPRVGPIMQQLGGTYKDTAVMLVAMREAGIPAAQAANAVKSAVASMIAPTKAASDEWAKYGINLAAIKNNTQGNPVQMIEALQSGLSKLSPLVKEQLIEKLFGKFQFARVSALLENFGKIGSQTQNALKIAGATSTELATLANQEMQQATMSPTAKWQRALETFKADLYPVGQKIVEVGTILINFANKVSQIFTGLPGPLKLLFAVLAGGVALSGPIIMLTGLMANFAGYIMRAGFAFKNLITGGKTLKEMLTPELLASKNAATLFSEKLLGDADAVTVLNKAVKELTASLEAMTSSMTTGAPGGIPIVTSTSGVGMKEQGLERSHLVGKFAPGSAGQANALAMFGPEVQAAFAPYITGVSNLVAELPMQINQALKTGSVSINDFITAWESRANKMLWSVGQGGANIKDPVIVAATNNLEKQIGQRAVAIAAGTEKQMVSDSILEQATNEVITANKTLATAEGDVARAMEVAALQVGQARIQIPTKIVQEGLANGTMTMGNGTQVMYAGEDVARSGSRIRSANRMPTIKSQGYSSYAKSASLSQSIIAEEQIAQAQAAGQAVATTIATSAEASAAAGITSALTGPNSAEVEASASRGMTGMLGKVFTKVRGGGAAGGVAAMGAMMLGDTLLPNNGAGGVAKGALNMAATGSMIGGFIPGVGMLGGAAIGGGLDLAIKGISTLIQREKDQQAIAKQTFTQSGDFAQIFGTNLTQLATPIGLITDKLAAAEPNMSAFAKSVKDFKDAVTALPANNPLKLLVDKMSSETASNAASMAKSFILAQAAINGIDPSKAQQMLNIMLGSTGHMQAIGSDKNKLPTTAEGIIQSYLGTAMSPNIQRQSYGSGKYQSQGFGPTTAGNTTAQSQQDMQKLQQFVESVVAADATTKQFSDGLKAVSTSAVDNKKALDALSIQYSSSSDKDAQAIGKQIDSLNKHGVTLAQVIQLYKDSALVGKGSISEQVQSLLAQGKLLPAGIWDQLANEIASAQVKANKAAANDPSNTNNSGSTVNTTTFTGTADQNSTKKILDAKVKSEDAILKTLKDQLTVEQKKTSEIKRQLDYDNQRNSLNQQTKEALISGNYLAAAGLRQQSSGLTVDFNATSKQNLMQTQIDTIQARRDIFSQAVADIGDAIANNSHLTPKSAISAKGISELKPTQISDNIVINNTINVTGSNAQQLVTAVKEAATTGTTNALAAKKMNKGNKVK